MSYVRLSQDNIWRSLISCILAAQHSWCCEVACGKRKTGRVNSLCHHWKLTSLTCRWVDLSPCCSMFSFWACWSVETYTENKGIRSSKGSSSKNYPEDSVPFMFAVSVVVGKEQLFLELFQVLFCTLKFLIYFYSWQFSRNGRSLAVMYETDVFPKASLSIFVNNPTWLEVLALIERENWQQVQLCQLKRALQLPICSSYQNLTGLMSIGVQTSPPDAILASLSSCSIAADWQTLGDPLY